MEDDMDERVNAITCTAWVPRGVAKTNPEKVEISKEELLKIIKETSEDLENLEEKEEFPEEKYEEFEVDALEEDLKIPSKKVASSVDEEMKDVSGEDKENMEKDDAEVDIEKEYNFDTYDDEKDNLETLVKLGRLTMHASPEDDPYITTKEDDNESETENHRILPTDNLITVGHVDGDAAILEVYVYNSEEGSLYVHHDILLPSIPLCMEWLNYDPHDQQLNPGNLVAIGSLSNVIDVWDLDIVDSLEPAFILGRKQKKKKKISRLGHSDAVLCLGWNKHYEHILASGSVDKSVILWDLQDCKESQKIKQFKGKVQDLKWHGTENKYLLTGCCDKNVRLIDCLTENSFKTWELDGEVESVSWDPWNPSKFNFYAATDAGTIYYIDGRKGEALKKFKAHTKSCSGMVLNPACPGCLVTVSEDETVKIWDVMKDKEVLVEERKPNLGVIHTVSSSLDNPFVLSIGGNNKMNNFKVWDMRQSKKVRQGFCDRLGLPVEDDDEEEEENKEEEEEEEEEIKEVKAAKWKPPPKSKKKKGGRLDRKKKR